MSCLHLQETVFFTLGGFADFAIIKGQSLPPTILRPNTVSGSKWGRFRLDSELDFHQLNLPYFKNTIMRIQGIVWTLIFLSALLMVASVANIKIVSNNKQFLVDGNTDLE